MPYKVVSKCSRCLRIHDVPGDSEAAGKESDRLEKVRAENAELISKYITENFKPEELPHLLAVHDGKIAIAYGTLCSPLPNAVTEEGEKSRRYCQERATNLLGDLGPIEPRKPRAKKPKADAPTNSAEAAANLGLESEKTAS